MADSSGLAMRLDFEDSKQSSPSRRRRDGSPILKSTRNSSRASSRSQSPVKAVSFRIDTSTVEAIAVEKVATPSPIPVTTSPSTRGSSSGRMRGKGATEESRRLSSRIEQITSSSSSPSPAPSSRRFSAKASMKATSTRLSMKKSGRTEELMQLSAKNSEAGTAKEEGPSSPVQNTNTSSEKSTSSKKSTSSQMLSLKEMLQEERKEEDGQLSAGGAGDSQAQREPSERSMLSGKLSPRSSQSSPQLWSKKQQDELKVEESAASKAEHAKKTVAAKGLQGLYNYFFAPPEDTGPGPFSLNGSVPPPIATRRVVLLGRDDVGKAYLQRKMLCTVGEVMGAGQFSRTGVRAASKMSTTGECAFVEVTDVPLEELEEELESENSYLLKRLLPNADAIVLAFDATEIEDVSISQDDDGEDTNMGYGGVACPSLVYLQDLYDRLQIDEILGPDTVKVVVGNVGLSKKIRPQDLPQQTIKAAEAWAARHEDEGLFYATLAVGNDRDVRIISGLLDV